MKRYFNISIFAILMGIMILICTSCASKVKHFYIGYGQTGYIHIPSDKIDKWMTFEIKAPEYDEVK